MSAYELGMLQMLSGECSSRSNFALQQRLARLRFLVAAEGSFADAHWLAAAESTGQNLPDVPDGIASNRAAPPASL